MPIKAAADKVICEMEMFGLDFERFDEEAQDKNRSELRQTAQLHLQIEIYGTDIPHYAIPRTEIKNLKFTDPHH
ncbi:hypothetical protein DFH29DRAFT_1002740 [Suillus ampliporus]|nr:hypothetical protein DFH29DRAFT_1002740 [Suillus ampliporus]